MRYVRTLVLVGAGVVAALMLRPEVRAGEPCVVPKAWGQFKGIYYTSRPASLIAFEDSMGTIRVVEARCGTAPKPDFEIRRGGE
jgi:hypothetical protein